jgi:hypothetical protein
VHAQVPHFRVWAFCLKRSLYMAPAGCMDHFMHVNILRQIYFIAASGLPPSILNSGPQPSSWGFRCITTALHTSPPVSAAHTLSGQPGPPLTSLLITFLILLIDFLELPLVSPLASSPVHKPFPPFSWNSLSVSLRSQPTCHLLRRPSMSSYLKVPTLISS